jgi:hypothetical protein
MSKDIDQFCGHSNLVELMELCRTNTDSLELISPTETQHSKILAWAFNPREGHGQGDAVIKDFLVAVHCAARTRDGEWLVQGKGLTRSFVERWTPGRILATSFATSFCLCEYSAGDGRLDILIVDLANRICVCIENKTGARLGYDQLKKYRYAMIDEVFSRSVFKDFAKAFVLLDVNHFQDEDDPEQHPDGWVRVNYEWLNATANRAELALERGNASAAFLLAYCHRQIDYETKEYKRCELLAKDLVIEFPGVIDQLREIRPKVKKPADWNAKTLDLCRGEGQLMQLCLQYGVCIDWLIGYGPTQLVQAELAKAFPVLGQREAENHVWEMYPKSFSINLPLVSPIQGTDLRWPCYVEIRCVNPQDQEKKFNIGLYWRPKLVPDEQFERASALVRQIFAKSGLGDVSTSFQKGKRFTREGLSSKKVIETVRVWLSAG